MPNEGETRPCEHSTCQGTQTFKNKALSQGARGGNATDSGRPIWGGSEMPAWVCDRNQDHFDADKNTYQFQRARVLRLATEVGAKVEFDEAVTWIKFRAAKVDAKFTVTPISDEMEPSTLADKSDSWLRELIKRLAGEGKTVPQLRREFERETDPKKKAEIAEQIRRRHDDDVKRKG